MTGMELPALGGGLLIGFCGGLWLGFKLWRQDYIKIVNNRMFGS